MEDALRNSTVNAGMFISAMSVAMNNTDVIAAFETETGQRIYRPATSTLDRMIDEQTGVALAKIKAFATWFRDNHWGAEDAPDMEKIFIDPETAGLAG